MSLPDIDFLHIRRHHGSHADAFEELCCQLANDELVNGRVRFDRKGRGGDGGVECFATCADGTEIGWQVKYYFDVESMLRSLEGSLKKALEKHPLMRRFIACFPFDLADSRRSDVKTALSKWDEWRDGQVKAAAAAGRVIDIDRWDAHAIKQRLTASNPRSAGRLEFWFDHELLTDTWFQRAFERTKDSLGERYSPETHIEIPVRHSILCAVRDPAVFYQLGTLGARIEKAAERVLERLADALDTATIAGASALTSELKRLADDRPDPFPLLGLSKMASDVADLAQAWFERLRADWTGREPSPAMVAVSDLLGALVGAGRSLHAPHWKHVDHRTLLVLGDAGTGKSHLLADACSHQLAQGRPALMVLGGKLPDAEPWGEILRDLDLPTHLQVKHFLGALNAAGEASGARALIAIDALNEKNGQAIWPDRLAGLLSDVREFPWVTVVLSCRTTYESVVIPDALDAPKLPRIKHDGFGDDDVFRYLQRRGISIPETPSQLEELCNPLFVRLVCDALKVEGAALMPESLSGISDTFELFTAAVARSIERKMNIARHRRVVLKVVDVLAREMSTTGRGEIGFDQADELVRSIYDGDDTDRDLLFQLESEGLLKVEQDSHYSAGADRVVRFTFERMGDHAIAAHLLRRSVQAGGTMVRCEPSTPLYEALADPRSRIVLGLLDALAIQLPERFGLELPDLTGLPAGLWLDQPFEDSLLMRRKSAFGARTWQLVEETGDDDLRFGTLIALATEPDHPFNVRVLDAELRNLSMPERDATWSVHLADSKRASHLVDWAWHADQGRVAAVRAELAAIQLAWFLTTTARPLRDRATKALVALLANRPGLAVELWRRFRGLDDGYVTERVMAALYGAAMQGRWSADELSFAAASIHADLFADRSPPANALLRDHALGLLFYALHCGWAAEGIDPATLDGPFTSAWPIEHVPDETIASYTRQYGDAGRWTDEIVSSCQDGDFGRYVLDYAIDDWSAVPIGTSPLPTALDLGNAWYEEFKAGATAAMIEAHGHLMRTMATEGPNQVAWSAEARTRVKDAKAAFRATVGSDMFEEWREKAEHWRAEGMYQILARHGAAEFNLAWARRWVVKRAHGLGWSEHLHGEFDRNVRGDRHTHTRERIGKKYQWLALYELVARMSDNLARLPGRDRGPLRLRNLDPSLLVERTSDDGWREFHETAFWLGDVPRLQARTPAEAIAWLHSSADILDGTNNIEVRSLEDQRDWLVLTGFETWRVTSGAIQCESWRRVACLVVRTADRDAALATLSAGLMTGSDDVPAAAGAGSDVHLGEFPWRWSVNDSDDWMHDWSPFRRIPGTGTKFSIRPTTSEYRAEATGYDGSVSENIHVHVPARWLMDGLGLRLTDGRSILYQDAQEVTRFMDPSVAMPGRSAALVDRDAFLELLKREGLVAIWTVAGEKNAYGDTHRDGFGGRFAFTRIFYTDGAELRALDRFGKFHDPSARQMASFLGVELSEGDADSVDRVIGLDNDASDGVDF